MRRKRIVSFLFACAGACSSVALGQAGEKPKTALNVKASGEKAFYVDCQPGRNQVSFDSQSSLEDFTGTCNKVNGEFKLDPKNLKSLSGKFWIRVEDMATGIALRDEHLRSADWLDAARNPDITIEITAIESPKETTSPPPEGDAAAVTLVGKCTIKGKTNSVTIPATLAYQDESPKTQKQMKGDIVRLRSEFKIKLSDYGVSGPKGAEMIGLKVADEIKLKVSVYGASEPPPKPLEADKPVGGSASQPAKPQPPKRPGN